MTITPHNPRPNPYIGPRAFEKGEVIYGRDVETRKLVNLLIAERIVLLYAPSGAGKTSLIQAALIPQLQLKKRDLHVWPVIRVSHGTGADSSGNASAVNVAEEEKPSPDVVGEDHRPSDENRPETDKQAQAKGANRYIFSLISSLESARQPEEQIPEAQLVEMSLAEYLDRRPRPTDKKIELFIFDQFEELLTLDPTDQSAKEAFFIQVGEALDVSTRWALFSMREDFIAALDPYLYLLPTRLSTTFRLDLLGEEAARQAIQTPTGLQSVIFNDDAAQQLVDDLRKVRVMQLDGVTKEQLGPYVEPVQLQVVCHHLWESLAPDDMLIDVEDIRAVGNVGQALADYYARRVSEIAGELTLNEADIRRWVESELITEQGLRGQVLMSPLKSKGLDNRAIARLENAHLVRAEKRGGAIWFELAHDRLVEPVRRDNIAWFETHLSLLQRQAALWDKQGHPDHLLLRDTALADAEAWENQPANEATRVEKAFLKACRELHAREQQEKENIKLTEQARSAVRLRRRAYALSVALVATAIITFIALILGNAAVRNANIAATEEAKANAASTQAVAQKATAEAYSLQADQQRATAQAASTQAVAGRALAQQSAADEAIQRLAAEAASANARTAQSEAERQRKLAEAQRDLALTRGIASQSQGLMNTQPDLALLLALEAEKITDTVEARSVIFDGLAANNHYLAAFHGHTSGVDDLAFSPDGRLLASANDYEILVWDVVSRQPASQTITMTYGNILNIAYSPDGRFLAAGDQYGEVLLWDAETGHPDRSLGIPVYKYYDSYYENRSSLAFSPDSQRLAFTNGQEYLITVWGITDSLPMTLTDYSGWITSLAFSPDGQILAAGNTNGQILLWDMTNGQMISPPLSNEAQIVPLTFLNIFGSENALFLISGAQDGSFIYWDIQQRAPTGDVFRFAPYRSVDASFDASTNLAFGMENGNVILTDIYYYSSNLLGHSSAVNSMAFSPDESLLASASEDGSVILWSVAPIPFYTQPFTDIGVLAGLAFDPRSDGKTLIAGYNDRIDFLDLVSGETVLDPILPATSTVQIPILPQSIAFNPNGTMLASGGDDGSVQFWNTTQISATALSSPTLGHTRYIYGLVFSPDSKRLASTGADNSIRLWDVASYTPISPALKTVDSSWSLAFSPDGSHLASGQADGQILIWDLTPSQPISFTLTGHTFGVYALAYSPDGKILASGGCKKQDESLYCIQGEILLWDMSSPEAATRPIKSLTGHTTWVTGFTFSPDSQTLASSAWDNTVLLWNIGRPGAATQIEPPLTGHANPVSGMAFSEDGLKLTTVSIYDGNVLIWDVNKRATIDGFRANPSSSGAYPIALSPNGIKLATIDTNGRIRIWDIPTRKSSSPFVGRKYQEAYQYLSSLAINPGGEVLAMGSQDGVVTLLDLQSRQPLTTSLALFVNPVSQLTFSPDGQWLIATDTNGAIKPLQLSSLKVKEDLFPPGQTAQLAAFSPAQNLLAIVPTGVFTPELWDLSVDPVISYTLTEHNTNISGLAFSPDGKLLATADAYGTILIHSVDLRQLKKSLYEPGASFTSLAFSPDGQYLAAGSYWGAIWLWDLNSGKLIATFQSNDSNDDRIISLIFNPDGKTLIAGGQSFGQIQFWQVDLAAWQARACVIAGRNLSWSEWQQYLADTNRPYQVTCPQNNVIYSDIVAGYLQQARFDMQAGDRARAEKSLELALAWSVEDPTEYTQRDICFAPDLDPLQASLNIACHLAARRAATPQARTEYYLQAQDESLAVAAWLEAIEYARQSKSFDDASRLCDYYLPEEFAEMHRSACLLAAELASDGITRMTYYMQAGEQDKAAEALQQSVDEALAVNTFEAASILCTSYGIPAELQDILIPACRLAAETAPDDYNRLYYYDLAGDVAKLSELLPQIISETLKISETYYLSDLCIMGVRNGLQDIAAPACRYLAETSSSSQDRGKYYALAGDMEAAEQAILQAVLEAQDSGDSSMNNDICWYGSIVGFAETVLPSCELAVELSGGYASYRDSRGLAYALIGFEEKALGHDDEAQAYFEKAIQDFQAYVEYNSYDGNPTEDAKERLTWIAALQAGRNPFDIKTLLKLLDW